MVIMTSIIVIFHYDYHASPSSPLPPVWSKVLALRSARGGVCARSSSAARSLRSKRAVRDHRVAVVA
eukprot:4336455-Lingulodinium_polyedra.AAC.1